MSQRITIINIRKGDTRNINDELQWLGNSLGLFNLRDRDSSCFRVFITLVKTARQNKPLSSDEIAERLNLSRSTVIHHLERLLESGIVMKERRGGYILRERTMESLIKDVHQDMEALFSRVQEVAKEIDELMG